MAKNLSLDDYVKKIEKNNQNRKTSYELSLNVLIYSELKILHCNFKINNEFLDYGFICLSFLFLILPNYFKTIYVLPCGKLFNKMNHKT